MASSSASNGRMTRQGLPTASESAGMSCVTTLLLISSVVTYCYELIWRIFDDAAGIAGSDTVGEDVVCHDAAGTDCSTVADFHAGEDDSTATDPAVIAYFDRLIPRLMILYQVF